MKPAETIHVQGHEVGHWIVIKELLHSDQLQAKLKIAENHVCAHLNL